MSKTKGFLMAVAVAALAFTLSGCASNIVKGTYDVNTPALEVAIDNSSARFSPDGKYFYAGSTGSDATYKIWNAQNGNEIFKDWMWLEYSTSPFSPDGKYLLTREKKSIKFWDLESRKEIRSFGFADGLSSCNLSPDGKTLVTTEQKFRFGGYNEPTSTKIWDVESGKEIKTFDAKSEVKLSPDGKLILVRNPNVYRFYKILDAKSYEEIASFAGSNFGGNVYFGDNRKIVWLDNSDFLVWEVTGGRNDAIDLRSPREEDAGAVKKFELAISEPHFSSDGEYILARSNFPPGTAFNPLNPQFVRHGHFEPPYGYAYSPNDYGNGTEYVYTLPYIGLWNANGDKLWDKQFQNRNEYISSLGFTADMKQIYAVFGVPAGDNFVFHIKLFDITDGREIASLNTGGRYPIITSDGKHAVQNDVHSFSLWDIESGKAKTFYGNDREFISLDVSKDGSRVLTSDGKVIRIWDLGVQ